MKQCSSGGSVFGSRSGSTEYFNAQRIRDLPIPINENNPCLIHYSAEGLSKITLPPTSEPAVAPMDSLALDDQVSASTMSENPRRPVHINPFH